MSGAHPISDFFSDSSRCVVLGGSGALGRSVCETLAARHCRVLLTYFQGERAAADLCRRVENLRARPLDLTRVAALERLLDEVAAPGGALGGLDALVHCAAVGDPGLGLGDGATWTARDVTEEAWDRLMAVNLKSAFFACRKAAEIMAGGRGGNLVLVGSVDAVKPAPTQIDYAASKSGLLGMARAMAKEFGSQGVRINVVVPGLLEEGLGAKLPARLRADYLEHCALKRLGRLGEVAEVIAWLALENTYVTGQTIVVDGGL